MVSSDTASLMLEAWNHVRHEMRGEGAAALIEDRRCYQISLSCSMGQQAWQKNVKKWPRETGPEATESVSRSRRGNRWMCSMMTYWRLTIRLCMVL